MIPHIKYLLRQAASADLKEFYVSLDALEDLASLIDTAIEEEPPISIKEGGIIKTGYNELVDKYRNAKTEGKQWLAQMEQTERDATGIKNLKIKFNKVFGFCRLHCRTVHILCSGHNIRLVFKLFRNFREGINTVAVYSLNTA